MSGALPTATHEEALMFTTLAETEIGREYVALYESSDGDGAFARTRGANGIRWDYAEETDGRIQGSTTFQWHNGEVQGCVWTLLTPEALQVSCDGTSLFQVQQDLVEELSLLPVTRFHRSADATNGSILCGGRGQPEASIDACYDENGFLLSLRANFEGSGAGLLLLENGEVLSQPVNELLEPLIPGATGTDLVSMTLLPSDFSLPEFTLLSTDPAE